MAYHHNVFSPQIYQLNQWVLFGPFLTADVLYQVKTSWSECLCNNIIDIQIHYACYLYLHYGPSPNHAATEKPYVFRAFAVLCYV